MAAVTRTRDLFDRKSSALTRYVAERHKVYSTLCSQAVTHPSTNRARRCLTSVIARGPVLLTLTVVTVTVHSGWSRAKCVKFSRTQLTNTGRSTSRKVSSACFSSRSTDARPSPTPSPTCQCPSDREPGSTTWWTHCALAGHAWASADPWTTSSKSWRFDFSLFANLCWLKSTNHLAKYMSVVFVFFLHCNLWLVKINGLHTTEVIVILFSSFGPSVFTRRLPTTGCTDERLPLFLSLTHSTAWRMLLSLFCMSSLIFSVHLFFGLPRK